MRNQSAAWIMAIAIIASFQVIIRAQTSHVQLPLAETMVSCTGEPVAITGTIDVSVQTTFDGSGGSHHKFHMVSKGKGVGAVTETKYVYSEEDNQELSESGPSDQTSFSWEINHLLISSSSEEDFFAKLTLHLTINANGVLTAFVDKVEADCR